MKRFTIIALVCIVLSFVFVFSFVVSFAYTDINPTVSNLNYSNRSYWTGAILDNKPSFTYSDSFQIDLTLSPPFSINKYIYFYNDGSRNNINYTFKETFSTYDYDYFITSFVFPRTGSMSGFYFKGYFEGAQVYSKLLTDADFNSSGSYSDNYLELIWSSSPVVFYVGQDTFTVQVVSFSSSKLYNLNCDTIEITNNGALGYSNTHKIEIIIPSFIVQGHYEDSGETSDESNSGDGSDISSQLDDINDSIVDAIAAIGNLGDDISQGFADLNSAEESRYNEFMGDDYSTDQSGIDNMGLQVSELDNNFSDHDIDISNGIDNLNSFDESALIDDIESAFIDLDDAAGHNDMHYTSFVQQLYNTLGIGTYLLFLVPFCMIFVLFKFVLGGVV